MLIKLIYKSILKAMCWIVYFGHCGTSAQVINVLVNSEGLTVNK